MEDHPRNSVLSLVVSAGCQICGPEASLYPQLVTSVQKLYASMSKHRKQGHKSFRKRVFMYCVDRIIVKPSDSAYTYLDENARQAKLLYNAAMFRVRNHFTASQKAILSPNEQEVEKELSLLPKRPGRVINAYSLQKVMVLTHNPDYYAGLPSQTAQHVAAQAVTDFRNWLRSLSAWKKDPSAFLGKPKMPHYVKGDIKDYIFTNQTASVRNGTISFPKTRATLPCRIRSGIVREIKVTPYYGNYLVSICYDVPKTISASGTHTAAIDFGVNNIMAVTSDTGESVLFKGGAVKAENQWFNKRRAELISIVTKGHPAAGRPSSKQLEALSGHRCEWMHDTFQKMSSRLIEWCESHDIGKLILGNNKGWKQNTRIGSKNNQAFVGVSFCSLQRMIRYKAERAGINVEEQEESYTSKASFIDNDCIPVYGDAVSSDAFSGRRIHRGLYKSKDGILVNADLNGAANILRKSGADTSRVELSALQEPLILRQSDLNTRIPIKGIAVA